MTFSNTSVTAILVLAALAGGSLPTGDGEPRNSDIVACHEGGSITRQEYRSWAEYRGLSGTEEPSLAVVQQLALIKTMAEATLRRQAGRPVEVAIAEQRRQLLIQALRQHLSEEYEIPADQVEALFQENPHVFDRPHKVLLRNIYKAFPPEADADGRAAVRQQMQELRRQLGLGADFATLAVQESESHTRYDGGRIGFVAAGQLAPQFDAVIAQLEEGEISQVIEHGDGLTLLKCEKIVPAVIHSPEETRELIRGQVRRHGINTGWAIFKRQLLAEAAPRYDPDAVQAPSGQSSWVLEVSGHRLDADELTEIAAARGLRPPAELPRKRLQKLLEELAEQLLLADHATKLGLAPKGMEQTLAWSRLEQLAHIELEHQVAQGMETTSEEEVRQHFTEHRERFQHPARWHVAALQLALPEGGDAEGVHQVSDEAHRLLGSITSGETTFAEAARSHSCHPSAGRGGDLGLLKAQQVAAFGPRVFRAVKGLQPGQVTSVMRLETGFWIFTLLGTEVEHPQTWSEAAAAARADLERWQRRQRQRQVRRQAADRLRIQMLTGQGSGGVPCAEAPAVAEPAGGADG